MLFNECFINFLIYCGNGDCAQWCSITELHPQPFLSWDRVLLTCPDWHGTCHASLLPYPPKSKGLQACATALNFSSNMLLNPESRCCGCICETGFCSWRWASFLCHYFLFLISGKYSVLPSGPSASTLAGGNFIFSGFIFRTAAQHACIKCLKIAFKAWGEMSH